MPGRYNNDIVAAAVGPVNKVNIAAVKELARIDQTQPGHEGRVRAVINKYPDAFNMAGKVPISATDLENGECTALVQTTRSHLIKAGLKYAGANIQGYQAVLNVAAATSDADFRAKLQANKDVIADATGSSFLKELTLDFTTPGVIPNTMVAELREVAEYQVAIIVNAQIDRKINNASPTDDEIQALIAVASALDGNAARAALENGKDFLSLGVLNTDFNDTALINDPIAAKLILVAQEKLKAIVKAKVDSVVDNNNPTQGQLDALVAIASTANQNDTRAQLDAGKTHLGLDALNTSGLSLNNPAIITNPIANKMKEVAQEKLSSIMQPKIDAAIKGILGKAPASDREIQALNELAAAGTDKGQVCAVLNTYRDVLGLPTTALNIGDISNGDLVTEAFTQKLQKDAQNGLSQIIQPKVSAGIQAIITSTVPRTSEQLEALYALAAANKHRELCTALSVHRDVLGVPVSVLNIADISDTNLFSKSVTSALAREAQKGLTDLIEEKVTKNLKNMVLDTSDKLTVLAYFAFLTDNDAIRSGVENAKLIIGASELVINLANETCIPNSVAENLHKIAKERMDEFLNARVLSKVAKIDETTVQNVTQDQLDALAALANAGDEDELQQILFDNKTALGVTGLQLTAPDDGEIKNAVFLVIKAAAQDKVAEIFSAKMSAKVKDINKDNVQDSKSSIVALAKIAIETDENTFANTCLYKKSNTLGLNEGSKLAKAAYTDQLVNAAGIERLQTQAREKLSDIISGLVDAKVNSFKKDDEDIADNLEALYDLATAADQERFANNLDVHGDFIGLEESKLGLKPEYLQDENIITPNCYQTLKKNAQAKLSNLLNELIADKVAAIDPSNTVAETALKAIANAPSDDEVRRLIELHKDDLGLDEAPFDQITNFNNPAVLAAPAAIKQAAQHQLGIFVGIKPVPANLAPGSGFNLSVDDCKRYLNQDDAKFSNSIAVHIDPSHTGIIGALPPDKIAIYRKNMLLGFINQATQPVTLMNLLTKDPNQSLDSFKAQLKKAGITNVDWIQASDLAEYRKAAFSKLFELRLGNENVDRLGAGAHAVLKQAFDDSLTDEQKLKLVENEDNVRFLARAEDPKVVEQYFGDDATTGNTAVADIIDENGRFNKNRGIHNPEVAKILSKLGRAVSDTELVAINALFVDPATNKAKVFDDAGYITLVQSIEAACNPTDPAAFYDAFGLSNTTGPLTFKDPSGVSNNPVVKAHIANSSSIQLINDTNINKEARNIADALTRIDDPAKANITKLKTGSDISSFDSAYTFAKSFTLQDKTGKEYPDLNTKIAKEMTPAELTQFRNDFIDSQKPGKRVDVILDGIKGLEQARKDVIGTSYVFTDARNMKEKFGGERPSPEYLASITKPGQTVDQLENHKNMARVCMLIEEQCKQELRVLTDFESKLREIEGDTTNKYTADEKKQARAEIPKVAARKVEVQAELEAYEKVQENLSGPKGVLQHLEDPVTKARLVAQVKQERIATADNLTITQTKAGVSSTIWSGASGTGTGGPTVIFSASTNADKAPAEIANKLGVGDERTYTLTDTKGTAETYVFKETLVNQSPPLPYQQGKLSKAVEGAQQKLADWGMAEDKSLASQSTQFHLPPKAPVSEDLLLQGALSIVKQGMVNRHGKLPTKSEPVIIKDPKYRNPSPDEIKQMQMVYVALKKMGVSDDAIVINSKVADKIKTPPAAINNIANTRPIVIDEAKKDVKAIEKERSAAAQQVGAAKDVSGSSAFAAKQALLGLKGPSSKAIEAREKVDENVKLQGSTSQYKPR